MFAFNWFRLLPVIVVLIFYQSSAQVSLPAKGQLLIDTLEWRQLHVASILQCRNEQTGSIAIARFVRNNFHGMLSFFEFSDLHDTRFHYHVQSGHVRVGLIVDMGCQGAQSVLQTLSRKGYFNVCSLEWLLLGTGVMRTDRSILHGLNTTISSSVFLLQPMSDLLAGQRSMAAVFDVYGERVVDDRKVNVLKIGSWEMASGLYIWDKRSTYQKRRTFGGITLKGLRLKSALTAVNEPSGIGELLWNSLSVVHNFSIKQHTGLTSSDTSQYDIIINPVEVDRNSGQKFHIIAAVGTSRSVVLFLHPEDAFRRNIFLRPFSLQLWLAVGGLCVATGLLIHKMHDRPPGNSTIVHRHNRSNEDYNISGLSLYVVEIFSQQGFTAPANSYGIRIMLQTIFIFAALLHQFFVAHMVGYLLVTPSKTVTTFRDLVKNEFTLVAENDEENLKYYYETNNEDLVRLKTASGHAYYNITGGISLIARDRTAFLCDAHRAYSWINRLFTDADRCRLQEIPLVPQRSIYLALAKDSPFKETFRITLLKITEHGLLQYQRKLWFAKKPECPENGVKMPEVNLDQASGAFWLLLFAGLVSSVFVLLEIVIERSRHGGV